MSDAPQIHQLMIDAQRLIKAVGKSDRNEGQNFNFRGYETVLNAVKPILDEVGIYIVPTSELVDSERYTTKNGAGMRGVTVRSTFTFTAADGSSVPAVVLGEAADSGDKALSKAQSVAERIALCQTFSIPTGEPDPDSESHERAPEQQTVSLKELGWATKKEYDEALKQARTASRSLPADDQEKVQVWLADQGWKFPYSTGQMDAWLAKVNESVGAEQVWDADDPGRPFTEDGD